MPRNYTSEVAGGGPMLLAELVYAGLNPGQPSLSETRGAREVVQDSTLPCAQSEYNKGKIDPELQRVLTAWGIEIVGMVDGDPFFMNVRLPEGWQKERTDHSMWTKLVDNRGRTRSTFFYKAAFYDRSAHMTPDRCLTVKAVDAEGRDIYDEPEAQFPLFGLIADREGHVLWRSESVDDTDARVVADLSECREEYRETPRARKLSVDHVCRAIAFAKLDELYPDHKDPVAYWDEDFSTRAIGKTSIS